MMTSHHLNPDCPPFIPSTTKKLPSTPLTVCAFNARSVKNKIDELRIFVKSHKIHVLAITESWLGEIVTDSQLTIPGFQVPFRKNRDGKGGGVCVFLSEQVYGKRRIDLEEDDLELLWIEIKHRSHPPLLVGCCYRPPSSTTNFLQHARINIGQNC